ncbi:MAG TPA: hypothetical protein DHV55_16095, partial [Clostridiaceae bacterium]|nr:hypothetical protein [Clostridiaceae bacterium]
MKVEFFWGNRRVKLLAIFKKNNGWRSIISFFILCLILAGLSQISNLSEKNYLPQGEVKIFSLLSKKNNTVSIVPDIQVIPSGESIGVKIESKGVLIVGLSTITDISGKKVCPAADGGFASGDKILKINGENIENEK